MTERKKDRKESDREKERNERGEGHWGWDNMGRWWCKDLNHRAGDRDQAHKLPKTRLHSDLYKAVGRVPSSLTIHSLPFPSLTLVLSHQPLQRRSRHHRLSVRYCATEGWGTDYTDTPRPATSGRGPGEDDQRCTAEVLTNSQIFGSHPSPWWRCSCMTGSGSGSFVYWPQCRSAMVNWRRMEEPSTPGSQPPRL